jgi:hypothetical protein
MLVSHMPKEARKELRHWELEVEHVQLVCLRQKSIGARYAISDSMSDLNVARMDANKTTARPPGHTCSTLFGYRLENKPLGPMQK